MTNITKIVIADDMEPILLYLEKVLSGISEFEIVGKAKNGKYLIDLVVKHKPEVVITDIEMPECGGLQAIEKLNKLGIKTKYIILTGNTYVMSCKEKDMGILKVIKKPILDDKKFIEQINNVVNFKEEMLEEKININSDEKNSVKANKENTFMKIINKIFKSK